MDLKKFQFHLKHRGSENEPIRCSKLEDKDTMDTAKLMTDHYGSNEALRVTKDILKDINQLDLLREMENMLGKTTSAKMHSVLPETKCHLSIP